MTTLASVQDVLDRSNMDSFTPEEESRIQALLTDATAKIRVYTGRQLVSGTYVQKSNSALITLNETPVTSITSVKDYLGAEVEYFFDDVDSITAAYTPFDTFYQSHLTKFTVTYVGGPASAPDLVVAICCNMVLRAFGLDPRDSGTTGESIQGYSYQRGTVGASGPLGLLDPEKDALKEFKSKAKLLGLGTIRVGF